MLAAKRLMMTAKTIPSLPLLIHDSFSGTAATIANRLPDTVNNGNRWLAQTQYADYALSTNGSGLVTTKYLSNNIKHVNQIETGKTNCEVEVGVQNYNAYSGSGISFRSDVNSGYVCSLIGPNILLASYPLFLTEDVIIPHGRPWTTGNFYRLKIKLSGNVVSIFLDDVFIADRTLTLHLTKTKFGLYSNGWTNPVFDYFKVWG